MLTIVCVYIVVIKPLNVFHWIIAFLFDITLQPPLIIISSIYYLLFVVEITMKNNILNVYYRNVQLNYKFENNVFFFLI